LSKPVISVEHLTKRYELGVIGTGSLTRDLERWWARARGQPDPYSRIGQKDAFHLAGQSILALDDVSFCVTQGEALGIIGRNGAGKSTLLKILSRVTAPSSGVVKVKGRIGSLLEVGTGFHPELTGRENIYLNGAILGMKKAEVARKFDEIVDFSGIEKFIDTPVKRYSSGMYVRLAFAVAAHLDPEILVVDEVLAVGDAEFQKKCLGKMGEVADKEGRTVLFVSHNLPSIRELCENCILLEEGKIILTDTSTNVINEYSKIQKEKLDIVKESGYLIWEGLINNQSNLNLTIDDDIQLIMNFKTHNIDLDNVFFDLELYNERFERIVHTKTKFINNGFSLKKNSNHYLKYKLVSPHLAPGKYTLSIYAYSDLGVLLWINGVDALEVTSKDPTGRLIAFDKVIAAIIPQYSLEMNEII